MGKTYVHRPEVRETIRSLKDKRANPRPLRKKAPKNFTRVPAHWLDTWEREQDEKETS